MTMTKTDKGKTWSEKKSFEPSVSIFSLVNFKKNKLLTLILQLKYNHEQDTEKK